MIYRVSKWIPLAPAGARLSVKELSGAHLVAESKGNPRGILRDQIWMFEVSNTKTNVQKHITYMWPTVLNKGNDLKRLWKSGAQGILQILQDNRRWVIVQAKTPGANLRLRPKLPKLAQVEG